MSFCIKQQFFDQKKRDKPKNKKVGNIADESLHRLFPADAYEKDYDDGYGVTAPVDSFTANELGLFNMSGNVWEWCKDWYKSDFYIKTRNKTNPINQQESSGRILRGGSWGRISIYARVSFRDRHAPSYTDSAIGFRFISLK